MTITVHVHLQHLANSLVQSDLQECFVVSVEYIFSCKFNRSGNKNAIALKHDAFGKTGPRAIVKAFTYRSKRHFFYRHWVFRMELHITAKWLYNLLFSLSSHLITEHHKK